MESALFAMAKINIKHYANCVHIRTAVFEFHFGQSIKGSVYMSDQSLNLHSDSVATDSKKTSGRSSQLISARVFFLNL